MADLILDSGALIACERNDRRFWVAFRRVEAQGRALVLPAPVFAQVWRHQTQAIIARLVKACEVVPMDLALARDVGALCAAAGTSDIVDACVVAIARRFDADVATSDPDDIRRLMRAAGAGGRVVPM